MNHTITRLQTELVIREKLPLRYAGVLSAAVFEDFSEKAREGAMLWLEHQLPDDFEISGMTVGAIMRDIGATAFEALCMLDLNARHSAASEEPIWFMDTDEMVGDPDA